MSYGMYESDTFFHLSNFGRIGLVCLSAILCALTIFLFLKISSRFALWVKPLIALLCLWLFTWLSRQIYYLYYMQLIDGLPLQTVIGIPPTITEILNLVAFTGKATLSDHSKGVLFWLMLCIVAYQNYQATRP